MVESVFDMPFKRRKESMVEAETSLHFFPSTATHEIHFPHSGIRSGH
jgi:hypothetical protein